MLKHQLDLKLVIQEERKTERYRTRTFGFTGITRSFITSRLFFREAVSIFTAWRPFALTVVTHREKLRRGASGIFRRLYNTDHF
ncbi:uncharacterized protein IAS62_006282 [Cryptococcus decagattii]|uniref:Uncharacterized protein n=1 Tax=Cryptococcus decagattii TaxID=1859122 RepID=A0ABZ2B5K3_9TREE